MIKIIILLPIFSLWTPIDFGTRYQTNTTTIREEAQFIATAVTTAQHQLWDLDQLSQHHQWGEVRNTVSWSSSGTEIRNQWPSRTLRIMQPVNVKSIKDFQANWTVRERSLRCSIRLQQLCCAFSSHFWVTINRGRHLSSCQWAVGFDEESHRDKRAFQLVSVLPRWSKRQTLYLATIWISRDLVFNLLWMCQCNVSCVQNFSGELSIVINSLQWLLQHNSCSSTLCGFSTSKSSENQSSKDTFFIVFPTKKKKTTT